MASLKFHKTPIYVPDPTRAKPFITAEEQTRAAENPPWPVPFHCKPWVDGQTAGWTLYYGYLTPIVVRGLGGGRIAVDNLEQLARETNQPKVVDQFADGYFGLSTGYYFQTPVGFASLFIPSPHAPAGLHLLTAVLETAWYARPIFLVYHAPAEGEQVALDYKQPIGRVLVVPLPSQTEAQAMTAEEVAALQTEEQAYLAEERTTPHKWTAATGASFTHLYKIKAREHASQTKAE